MHYRVMVDRAIVGRSCIMYLLLNVMDISILRCYFNDIDL